MLLSTCAARLRAFRSSRLNIQNAVFGSWLAVYAILHTTASYAALATPAQLDITPSGAASYSIPIVVPPGTAGMEPNLALSYNSQSGNGLAGMGWGVSGLSTITRCPKTKVQDGIKQAVTYTNSDRYCLDGQRLVVSNGGVYGADGTEYRTERESFSKIVSYGAVGSTGPAWFKVWTKSGQIVEFGNTADSAVKMQGTTAIRAWAVNKVSDHKNNYLTAKYFASANNEEWYLDRIDYTGNDNPNVNLLPYNSVRFVYSTQPRTDIEQVFDGGSLMKTAKLLTNIQTYAKVNNVDTLVKDYRLAYDTSQATGRSRLISLQECDSTPNGCLPATQMASQGLAGTFTNQNYGSGGGVGYWAGWASNSTQSFHFADDFNGDGKTDFMYWNSTTGGWHVLLSGTNGFSPVTNWGSGGGTGYCNCYQLAVYQPMHFTGDFNGDGRADFMYWEGSWRVLLSSGPGLFSTSDTFLSVSNWGTGGGYGMWQGYQTVTRQAFNFTGDFNGDGRTDLMYWDAGGWQVLLSNGTSFSPVQNWHSGGGTGYWTGYGSGTSQIFHFTGDFNGDGMTDFMYWDGAVGGWHVLLSTGTDFAPAQNWGSGGGVGYWPGHNSASSQPFHFTGDFNGDGKTDFMYWDQTAGGWQVLLSTGTSFAPVQNWGTGSGAGHWTGYAGTSSQEFHFANDFNGDGKTDFMYWDQAAGGWQLLLSTGTSFTPAQNWGTGGGAGYWSGYNQASSQSFHFAGDFDGDGKSDLMYWDGALGGWRLLSNSTSFPDLLTSITNGLSASANMAYKPITDATIYSKEVGDPTVCSGRWGISLMICMSTTYYPAIDIQSSMYVVSHLSSSNGIGGSHGSSYSYSGAKGHLEGGGFMGFRHTTAIDDQTSIKTYTEFRQDYPYQGLMQSRKKLTSGQVVLESILNTWVFDTNPGWSTRYHVPKLTSVYKYNIDLNGTLTNQATTCTTYDGYGNPTYISVWSTNILCSTLPAKTGLFVNEITNEYYPPDLTNWILNLLKKTTLTNTTP